MSDFNLTSREEGNVVVIETTGYLNNVGGEKIAEVCYKEMDGGKYQYHLSQDEMKDLINY